MVTCNFNVLAANEKNLQFIGEHKQAFDLEYLYPLDIFERLVAKSEPCAIECSCKIESDKLDPARFNLAIRHQRYAEQAQAVLEFFRAVETRVGVKLNYDLLHQFMYGFDYSKVTQIMAGIDARVEFADARVKTWWAIKDYPEKLETAIALHGDSPELRLLLAINYQLVVGFHLYLNGHSTIRLYPLIPREKFLRMDVQMQLAKVLSLPALRLFDYCHAVSLVLKKDGDKILHYHLLDNQVNSFIDNLHNDMATRVHAHYRDKPIRYTTVSLSERELLTGSIKTINMYYMNN